MTTGRGFLVFTALTSALLTSCSSTSLVPCKTNADCAPYAGTVCYEGDCRKPSTIKGDTDFAMATMMSLPDGGDMAATPEPPDLSLFCGDGGLTSCPASTPVCDDNECRGCTTADDPVCAARSIFTPRCDQPSGTCVACTTDADCVDGVNTTCSFDGSCRVPCSTNTDCTASAVCDFGTFNGTSVCARADEVVYVSGNCGSVRDGGMATPYCNLDGAVTQLSTGGFIRVLDSTATIAPSSVGMAHTYVIVGSSNNYFGSNAAASGMQITSGGNVLVYGLNMLGLSTGILCTSAKLAVRHSVIASSTEGIDATGCTLTIDATWLSRNGTGASLHGASGLQMTNSIVSENTTVGLSIADTSSMSLNYDTIANNATAGTTPGAIAYGSTTTGSYVYNSIIYGNKMASGSSWTGTFAVANCDSETGGTYATAPGFVTIDESPGPGKPLVPVNTYHLVVNNTDNETCCVDKGKLENGKPNPKTDYDGDTRPKGGGYDIGADEAQ